MRACIYCKCTEDEACALDVATLINPSLLGLIDARLSSLEDQLLGNRGSFPFYVGCSWISTRPPVCSNPECVAKHARRATPQPR